VQLSVKLLVLTAATAVLVYGAVKVFRQRIDFSSQPWIHKGTIAILFLQFLMFNPLELYELKDPSVIPVVQHFVKAFCISAVTGIMVA